MNAGISFKKIMDDFLFKEKKPFTNKRDYNWDFLFKLAGGITFIVIGALLFWPEKKPLQEVFHEKTQNGSVISTSENDPTAQTTEQIQSGSVNLQSVHSSLDHLYAPSSGGIGGGTGGRERNAAMILARSGNDAKIQLSAGTRIFVSLTDKVIVSNQAMPMMGIVVKDVIHDDDLAIPQGSKVLGSVSFDESSERANVTVTSIIFPDGRERQLSAIGIGSDEQVGVDGNVRSTAVQNTIGQTLTRFIGAYAQGSMSTGQFGAQAGGYQNGVKNAIAATAEDRANAFAEDMKKQKKWIELSYGTQFMAVLNQSFIYREPGNTYGR